MDELPSLKRLQESCGTECIQGSFQLLLLMDMSAKEKEKKRKLYFIIFLYIYTQSLEDIGMMRMHVL